MVNPFTGVSLAEYHALEIELFTERFGRDDAQREVSGLRIQLQREQENAGRLTELAARAVATVNILEQALIERQIGSKRDPSLVLIANLPDARKKQHGFVPLKKRRRDAAKRNEAEAVRRNALPKLTAELPSVPLTKQDREAMREAVGDLSKETP
jgi:hypothetical protein